MAVQLVWAGANDTQWQTILQSTLLYLWRQKPPSEVTLRIRQEFAAARYRKKGDMAGRNKRACPVEITAKNARNYKTIA